MNKLIFPFKKNIGRIEKENLLNQRAKVIWLTGLSGSGKSTIAQKIEKELFLNKKICQILDGDDLRSGITKNLGFTDSDRSENIRITAEVAKVFLESGLIVIVSLISPFRKDRKIAKDIIGSNDFLEVYVDTPLEICEKRDPKGLYKKARDGFLKNMTGIDSPYEEPDESVIRTSGDIDKILEIING